MILMIDNYDSFTYNLVQYFMMLGADMKVVRNDAITIEGIREYSPDAITISPGPGRPENAGISVECIKEFSGKVPILGICLGHQAICYAFGGNIIKAEKLMHGKTSMITSDGKTIYKDLPNPFEAMRYHSLVVSKNGFPDCLEISARSDDDEIMGIRHKEHFTEGIQFHPESIMTKVGKRLIRNFINIVEQYSEHSAQ